MTVADLIAKLRLMPQDEIVYRWDSDRQRDGSETCQVICVVFEPVELYAGEQKQTRVVIS